MIEIDAASNNGVEEIEISVKKQLRTTQADYKVYIIDEVHMLSMEKCALENFEEPPKM